MTDNAAVLQALHREGPLVLPNAWDAGSAAAIEAAGAKAIATTSAGIAWAYGVPDGGGLDRASALAALARIVRAVDVPVSADIEAGYDDVAATVADVIALGVGGINLEDRHSASGGLLGASAQADRLRVARSVAAAAGVDLCINARTDVYLGGSGQLAEVMDRADAYADAGADVLFVPGVVDAEAIKVLVSGPLPLNVMVHPGALSVSELIDLGVARISVGSAIAQAAYGLAAAAAWEVLAEGTYTRLENGMDYGELNELLV
ncbi:isocitrate lyase/phosphoenolpyruvate mutase family protein [Kribbella sp. NBC_01245]|uniref:isocitrate lyase/PEP mutase family protein n=1 Tax=Kribbella sp. NBC_01245 TaxID=2903578 RepID=UPI002E2A0C5C|nr:isocitrate lyase/phosphoenolpyruvate mutase family protein [Kribbella sp. NBC_01245]